MTENANTWTATAETPPPLNTPVLVWSPGWPVLVAELRELGGRAWFKHDLPEVLGVAHRTAEATITTIVAPRFWMPRPELPSVEQMQQHCADLIEELPPITVTAEIDCTRDAVQRSPLEWYRDLWSSRLRRAELLGVRAEP